MTGTPLRVVLDTNVLISAGLAEHSGSGAILRAVLQHCVVLRSDATFREFQEVLMRGKFDRYKTVELRRAFLDSIREVTTPVEVKSVLSICVDPKDDKFLELAVDGEADFLVSGDDHLLRLHPFRDIPIIRPMDFLLEIRD